MRYALWQHYYTSTCLEMSVVFVIAFHTCLADISDWKAKAITDCTVSKAIWQPFQWYKSLLLGPLIEVYYTTIAPPLTTS